MPHRQTVNTRQEKSGDRHPDDPLKKTTLSLREQRRCIQISDMRSPGIDRFVGSLFFIPLFTLKRHKKFALTGRMFYYCNNSRSNGYYIRSIFLPRRER